MKDVNSSIEELNKSVLELKASVELLNQSSTEYSTKIYHLTATTVLLTWVLVFLTAIMTIDVIIRLRAIFVAMFIWLRRMLEKHILKKVTSR